MPDNSANLTIARQDGTSIRAYMSVFVGAEVAAFTLNAIPSYPAKDLAVTLTSGSAANIKQGYRVDVFTSTGLFKGRTRVRYAGTISSTNLPIREHSRGVIKLAAGDIIRVYAEVRLSDKLVSASAQFPPDDLAYSDQGSNPPPLACSGGPYAGWTTSMPVPLTGSTSIAVDPDSSGTLSHLWAFPAGLTASSTTTADPNITAATAGQYLLVHDVTDASNSKVTTQRVPHIYHDADNPPYEVLIENVEGNEETGHTFTVQVFEDADLTSIPDGSLVILWMDQYIGGAVQAFGMKSSGRSHILGVGYIRREEGTGLEDGTEALTFEVISPMARVDEPTDFSRLMVSSASPNAWKEMKALSTKRAIIQLWMFYLNACEAGFDLVFSSTYTNRVYPRISLRESTPLGQIQEIAAATQARIIADRTSRFEVHKKPEYTALSGRAALTRTVTLTADDLIDWRYSRKQWRPVKWVILEGFSSGANPLPKFSRWPGTSPGVGGTTTKYEKVIVDESTSQEDMNELAGLYGAATDGIYVDDDGVQHEALDFEVVLPVSYHFADFYDEVIEFDMVTQKRGLDLSTQLFVLRGVALELDAETGTWRVRWTLRTVTAGAKGMAWAPNTTAPPEGVTPIDTTPLTPPALPSLVPEWSSDSDNKVPLGGFLLNASGAQAAAVTAINLTTGALTATEISTCLSGNGMWAASDPFDYRRKFALTTAGLDKTDNFKSFTSWASVANNNAIFGNATRVGHKVITSINKRGWIMVMSHSMIAVSFDYGASWTVTDPGSMATYGTSTVVAASGDIAVSPHNSSGSGNGWVYASVYVGVLNGNQFSCRIYQSSDWGLTWTLKATRFVVGGTIAPGCRLVVPYRNNTGALNTNSSAQEILIGEGRQNGGFVYRVTNSTMGAGTLLYSVTSTTPYPVMFGQSAVTAFTNDSSYWWVGTGQGTTHGVAKGIDASGTAYNLGTPTSSMVSVNGWPLDPNVAIVFTNQGSGSTPSNTLSITFNGGVTFYNSLRPVFFTGNNTAYAELDLSDFIAPQ